MPPNLQRKARRKRQTRLTFDPVDQSSSPSNKSPARIRYQLDGAKRTPASSRPDPADVFESDDVLSSSKKDDLNPSPQKKNGKLPFKSLPTPAKSSQPQAPDTDSSDTLEIEHDPRPSTSARQTRSFAKFMPRIASKNKRSMGFDGTLDSSDESDAEPKVTPSKNKSSNKKNNTIISLISDTDDASAASVVVTPNKNFMSGSIKKVASSTPTRPTRSSAVKNKMSQQKSVTLSDSDDDELVPLSKLGSARKSLGESSTPRLPRLRTSGKQSISKDNESSDDDLIVSSPKRSQKPTYQLRRPAVIDDDEDEDDDIRPSPIKRRMRQPFEDDEEDEVHSISPQKRLRPTVESTASSDLEESPLKRRRRGTQKLVDSDDEPAIPRRNSRGRSQASASTTPTRTTRQQKGKKKHRTAREKQMEMLRRKKNGDSSELTDSESGSNSDDDEFEQLEEFEDEEEEAPVRNKPAKSKQKSANPNGNMDDLDDFVIDDDEDDDIGVPTGGFPAIPLEFTHNAHKKLVEHFKDAVEWMVHNKINPAFLRNDPVYKQAFRKLDDECSGLAKSKFASTQWTQEFTRAVYARPVLEVHQKQAGEGFDTASGAPKCFACNHRNHTPSAVLCFTGKAYDRNTLEDLDQGSDDSEESKSSENSDSSGDSDDGDESKSVNSQGQDIPPVTKRYAVGSTCRQNTEYAHQLIHWKYNLNQWVISALEVQGELTPAKLAEREAMNAKKRTKYTNTVVDDWAASGQIKELWGDYKRVLTTARELKAQHRGGWK